MKLFSLSIVLLFFVSNTSAQVKSSSERIHIYDGPINIDESKAPLVKIDTFTTKISRFFINTNNIESINVLKDSNAIVKYGENAKNGVIIIQPKKNCKLLNLETLLKAYNLSNENKHLRVCVNKTLIKDPQLLLFDSQKVKTVEITTDFKWITTDEIKTGEKFINIVLQEN